MTDENAWLRAALVNIAEDVCIRAVMTSESCRIGEQELCSVCQARAALVDPTISAAPNDALAVLRDLVAWVDAGLIHIPDEAVARARSLVAEHTTNEETT